MKRTICAAISSKKILRFYYKGGYRNVEPFCHGISKGNEVLRGFQVSGHSESGERLGWKLFRVSEIANMTITNEQFDKIRPGYNPNDSSMDSICCYI